MVNRFKHPELGIVELHIRRGSTSIRAKVLPDLIKITIPYGYEKSILPLSGEMVEKLSALREKIKAKESDYIYTFEIGKEFKTLTFTAIIDRQIDPDNRYFTGQLKDGVLAIKVPQSVDMSAQPAQDTIKRIVKKILTDEARRVLPERLLYWSKKCNLPYNTVEISSAKSRWGSCDNKKNIRLSYWLMLIPERNIDYVIVHELCHTKEMNHGPKFKKMLYGYFPDYEELEKQQKELSKKVTLLNI